MVNISGRPKVLIKYNKQEEINVGLKYFYHPTWKSLAL